MEKPTKPNKDKVHHSSESANPLTASFHLSVGAA